jgi:hypothetical protein
MGRRGSRVDSSSWSMGGRFWAILALIVSTVGAQTFPSTCDIPTDIAFVVDFAEHMTATMADETLQFIANTIAPFDALAPGTAR